MEILQTIFLLKNELDLAKQNNDIKRQEDLMLKLFYFQTLFIDNLLTKQIIENLNIISKLHKELDNAIEYDDLIKQRDIIVELYNFQTQIFDLFFNINFNTSKNMH